MHALTLQPLVPPAAWLGVTLALVSALVWTAASPPASIGRLRWVTILTLQAISAALVVAILLNPTTRQPAPPPPGRPSVTILLDSSASMGRSEADGSRFAAAARDAADLSLDLSQQADVVIKTFDASVRTTDAAGIAATRPSGEATDIAEALRSATSADRPAGQAIVLLSDGIHNADIAGVTRVLDAANATRVVDAPVFIRTYGSAGAETDLALELRATQDLTLLHQTVPVAGRVRYVGAAPATTVARLVGEDGIEVAQTAITLRAGGDEANLLFPIAADRVGVHRYTIKLDPIAGELTTENDQSPYVMRVVDEPIRALVLEGKPYWDASFLLRTLAADPAIAVDAMVRVREDRVLRRTLSRGSNATSQPTERSESNDVITNPQTVLSSVDALRPYQVVVVGRDADAFLTPAAVDALRQWISTAGGSLVCYRGNPTATTNEPLARLLPTRWSAAQAESRVRMSLTDEGREMRWTLDRASDDPSITQRMPTLASDRQVSTEGHPLAIVLATAFDAAGQSRPAVTYQPFGSGRVVVIEGSGLWRWSFLPPRFRERETVYASLWQSLLRWLASGAGALPGQSFTLRADRVVFDADTPATATLFRQGETMDGPTPAILLRSADDATTTRVTPTALEGNSSVVRVAFGRLSPGTYTAAIEGADEGDAGQTISFDVQRFGREMLDLQPRPDLMQRIAELSGGAALPRGPLADAVRQAIAAHRQRAMMDAGTEIALWDRPAVMILVLGLWLSAWVLRRRSGLT